MKMICLNCPTGCLLEVSLMGDKIETTGQKCSKGLEFAEREWFNPMRMLTTTVKTDDDRVRRVPVRTTSAIPKGKIMEAMAALDKVVVTLPIESGTVILRDLLNLGVDIIATFTMANDKSRIQTEKTFELGGHQ